MYGDKSMSVGKEANGKQEHPDDVSLKDDLRALKSDFAALRDDVMQIGKLKAADATDKASKLLHAADKETRAAGESIQQSVRENPIASLGAAVALGFVMGRTLLRR